MLSCSITYDRAICLTKNFLLRKTVGNCVAMTNGERLPIPVKKYKYIKEKLVQIYNE